jgi:wobble nucleotide-excising tRNase
LIDRLQLLRNIGQFDSVDAGSEIPLKALSLVYAENGRGKTTLAAILRSLQTGNPVSVIERHRLAASNPPYVVVKTNPGTPAIFENGNWSRTLPEIAVFDDVFVAENVCSGMDVGAEHRQNLHELILGAQGVALNATLQGHVAAIEEHNRNLRAKGDAIPATARGALTVDAFCALQPRPDIDQVIQEAERNLAAARSSDAIRQQAVFDELVLPDFDLNDIEALLNRDLPELEADAAARVQAHLASLGSGGEAWISDGMRRINAVSAGHADEICPFCAQELSGSSMIAHYRAYFSNAYSGLKQTIAAELASVRSAHSGEVVSAFERAVRVAAERRQFWSAFMDLPEIALDTAAIARAWKAALEPIVAVLRAKQASPLDRLSIPADVLAALAAYRQLRETVTALNASLQTVNTQISIVKEKAAAANVATMTTDLAHLTAIKVRYSTAIAPLCAAYLSEKTAKTATEGLRDTARNALDHYRNSVFPAYETAINTYLLRFNAGFGLASVNSVNTRAGSACTYSMLINSVAVPITPGTAGGPSFRNTLSAGDRNTLALAFFFASLDQDPQRAQKIVVIDDPMTSLDEHRALTTVQEMRRLLAVVGQVIVLSHSKPFLCALWEGADKAMRRALKLSRDGGGSTIAIWDVNQDCITEHDRRHALVRRYMQASGAADERSVAAALRPILESFMRVAYPDNCPPGTLLGPFLGICNQREGTLEQIMDQPTITELRDLLDYANKFHHDTNAAWQTAAINDSELQHFCHRTIAFTRHR